jgi:hypothetical protein
MELINGLHESLVTQPYVHVSLVLLSHVLYPVP